MKLLFLTREYPFPTIDGGKVVEFNLLKELAKNHQITLLASEQKSSLPEHYEQLKSYDVKVETVSNSSSPSQLRHRVSLRRLSRYPFSVHFAYTPAFRRTLRRLQTEERYEVIHISGYSMGLYYREVTNSGALIAVNDARLLYLKRAQLVEETYRSQIAGAFRAIHRFQFMQYERRVLSNFSHVTVLSPPDAEVLRHTLPRTPITAIPAGVNTTFFKPEGNSLETDIPSIVFTGNMSYFPNRDAALYFVQEIWPKIKLSVPNIKFFIVGRNPDNMVQSLSTDAQIIVTGEVDDIRPYLEQATVYVCPLRVGSGLKNKVLEAMAMQKPIVATTLSCDGINLTPGKDVLIGDRAETFASAVIELLRDKAKSQRLGANARRLAENVYSWNAMAEHYTILYNQIAMV